MPKDPHITGGIRHDWAAIKHEYVTDPNTSLRKIAKKYGVSLNTIAKKSKAEDWFATRKKTQTRVVTKGITKTTNKMADELAKELEAVEKISSAITSMLQDEKQFNKHFVEVGEGSGIYHTELWEYEKVDVKQIKETLSSLKMIEEMKRSIIGIQRIDQLQKAEIDRERLELEKERFEFEKQKAEFLKPDANNKIVIEGMEKGWAE